VRGDFLAKDVWHVFPGFDPVVQSQLCL
jgi:hypothetical protein